MQQEKNFWDNPDYWLAAVLIDGDQVYAKIKGQLALLEGIPKPETGFFYMDIVQVTGPAGKQHFKDDEIPEYKAMEVYKKSNCPTFIFTAILPQANDYFYLHDEFDGEKLKVEFPWSSEGSTTEWKNGYCTAESLAKAKQLLNQFASKGEGRKVKDIKPWDA
jgi:hypothetical protein